MILYQIIDPVTKLYSKGGYTPTFNRNGKVWAGKAAFAGHLAQHSDPLYWYSKSQVIVIDCTNETFTTTPFVDWWAKYSDVKLKKQQESEEKAESKRKWDAIQTCLSN